MICLHAGLNHGPSVDLAPLQLYKTDALPLSHRGVYLPISGVFPLLHCQSNGLSAQIRIVTTVLYKELFHIMNHPSAFIVVEHLSRKRKVHGSIPCEGTFCTFLLFY